MIPSFAKKDLKMFYRYLDKSKVYFEFGSGGSTYQASIRNIKTYSVESDITWINKLKNVRSIFNEMDTLPNTWGSPGINATDKQKINYSDSILQLTQYEQKQIQLILIDGRFRVACCLKSHSVMSSNCLIAFDDFLNRNKYHIVLNYFDIVEKTSDERMVILRKKNVTIPPELIKQYELNKA